MNWIKKLIPAYIEIRSVYWVEHGKKMQIALGDIFDAIDNDKYEYAAELVIKFENDYTQSDVPEWIAIIYSEIYRANSIIHFLK